jgi:hypothetical protein
LSSSQTEGSGCSLHIFHLHPQLIDLSGGVSSLEGERGEGYEGPLEWT